jgi:excisionase family DNA binding protein
MDYQTNYTNTYNQIFLKREAFFKDQLVLAKQLNQTFNYTSNTLLKNSNAFLTSKIDYFMEEPYLEIMVLFNNRFSMYEDNRIKNIIEYHIEPFVAALDNNETYNLNDMICKIAELDAIKEASRIFKNNYSLDQFMYILNDFRKFELKEYTGSFENHPLYTKLRNKVYPKSKIGKTTIKNTLENENVYLDVKQVAEITNYTVSTIYDLKHKRKIPFYKNGAKLQFKKSEILDWMEKGKGITKDDLEAKATEYLFKNS